MYPIMLNLENKEVVVIGGGKVAERKVTGLLGEGAHITVVSPHLTETLMKLSQLGQIKWRAKNFSKEDVEDAFLIFAATNNGELNHVIKRAAKDHQLVNMADQPEKSDFHTPSQVKRGRLSIAISTNGASPVLAKKIRQKLETEYDYRYEQYLEFLFIKRKWILRNVEVPELRMVLLESISDTAFLMAEDRNEKFAHLYEDLKDHFS